MLAFVMGTGRCGTTLVQEVLARHGGVGFISGLDDKLPRLNLLGAHNGAIYRRTSAREPGLRPMRDSRRLLERGRMRIAPSEGWNLLDRQVMSGFSKPCRDLLASDITPYLARRLHDFFDPRIEAQGCDVLLHRLTGWPRSGLLQAAYPDAKFIHVVRDGRAVANSWLQMGWWDGWRGPDNWYLGPLSAQEQELWDRSGRSFPVLAALGWRRLIEAADEARAQLPDGLWMDVRYEDVLANPQELFPQMLEFLNLPWTREFSEGMRRHQFEAARSVAYRKQLRPQDIAAMERVIGDQLQRWGYELEAATTVDIPRTPLAVAGGLTMHGAAR